jgi:hypothetical protein
MSAGRQCRLIIVGSQFAIHGRRKVGKRKGQMAKKIVCTYCGEPKKLTNDHVIPRSLFVEPSNERSITVGACRDCQEGKEGLLKTVFAFLDQRILEKRIAELKHPKAAGERRDIFDTIRYDPATRQYRSFFTQPTMRALNKMFLGMRRYLMEEVLHLSWSFLGQERVCIFKLDLGKGALHLRRLPLDPEGQDNVVAMPLSCSNEFLKCDRAFRDFHIGSLTDNCSFVVIRYCRADFEFLGNRFWLYAYFASTIGRAVPSAIPQ